MILILTLEHLGGWKFNDSNTYERELWDWAIERFNITSIMDIGCGIGCSTIYFQNHPNVNDVLCVEGSIDAINNSLVPNISKHHDYTLGGFWPNKVYGLVVFVVKYVFIILCLCSSRHGLECRIFGACT